LSELIIQILILGGFIALLVKSAIFAIESIVKFSKITGIGELAAGFVIVAVATSTPEISVAFFSTASENIGITLGDIFGSNVTNIALISAIFLLISPIKKIEHKTLRTMLPLLLASSAIPLLLLMTQDGTKFIGVALLAVFGFFLYYVFKFHPSEQKERVGGSAIKPLVYFFIGISLVIVSSKFIVDSASFLAESTGIRESVIGATVVAIGTSLPELTIDIVAVKRRHLDLALGDIVGSCISNITLVLGIVLVLSSVSINFGILSSLIGFAMIAPFALFVFIRKALVKKWHSFLLFGIYAAFLLTIYEIQLHIGGIKIG
jgi:cation:H+ antiporter